MIKKYFAALNVQLFARHVYDKFDSPRMLGSLIKYTLCSIVPRWNQKLKYFEQTSKRGDLSKNLVTGKAAMMLSEGH